MIWFPVTSHADGYVGPIHMFMILVRKMLAWFKT
jgi:hypothetical protein